MSDLSLLSRAGDWLGVTGARAEQIRLDAADAGIPVRVERDRVIRLDVRGADEELDEFEDRADAGDDPCAAAHARMVAEVHNAWRGENTSARADHDEDDRADASDDEAEQARARMIAETHGERGGRAPRLDAAHTSRAPASGAPGGLQRSDPRYPAGTITRAGDGTLRIDLGHIGSGSGL